MAGPSFSSKLKRFFLPKTVYELAMAYLVYCGLMVLVGFVLSVIIRLELHAPGVQLVQTQSYKILILGHGIYISFLGLAPLLFAGMGYLITSVQFGHEDLGWKFLGRLAFWVLVASGVLLCAILIYEFVSMTGAEWTIYPPLTSNTTPNNNILWGLILLLLICLSTTLTAIHLLTLLFRVGRDGVNKVLPFSGWLLGAVCFVTIFSFGYYAYKYLWLIAAHFQVDGAGALVALIDLDRLAAHSLPDIPYLWLIRLSTLALIAAVIVSALGRDIIFLSFNKLLVTILGAGAIIVVLGAEVREANFAHFISNPLIVQFAVSLPVLLFAVFWVVTIFSGRVRAIIPLIWVLSSLVLSFTIIQYLQLLGGRNLDRYIYDTYYIVAATHMIFMLSGVLALFGGWYAFFSEITGRHYRWWLGLIHLFLTVSGVILTFLPQLFLGLNGMPRRFVDYPDAYAFHNMLSSIGTYILVISVILFFVTWKFSTQRRASDDVEAENIRAVFA